jgi:Type I phosphodiesterase / nucleotide pyrophosphatase
MSKFVNTRTFAALSLTAVMAAQPLYAGPAPNRAWGQGDHHRHVLLISIDGMHALDYQNCVASNNCPNLAALGKTGLTYTRTTTSRPSDSFPGLMALVTGGTPRTVGAFYDVAYDRVLAPPTNTTGNGLAGGSCIVGQINGTQTEYEEGVELDQTRVNGGGPYSTFDGGVLSIDPTKLARDPFNSCKPVYPWNFVRTNTIYGVIHAAGGFTAWSDKHPVYAVVSGPTGTTSPSNVDDYYAPEVNSNVINIPGFKTANGLDCSTISNNTSSDWTTDFDSIKCYDQLKVNAVVNWINGKSHLGTSKQPVPVIFGMNFQAVSVGEKLIEKINGAKVFGGYSDAAGTPTPAMAAEIAFVDAAIGQMVAALKHDGLLDSTTIIITAKHGQSPMDPNRFFPIPGPSGNNGQPPSVILTNLLPAAETTGLGPTEDDISQLWLTNSSDTLKAVGILEANAAEAGIGQIFYGASLTTLFNAPGVPTNPGPCCFLRPGGDPRTPDIIVAPNVGVVYTGSSKKQSEHGGFAWDDTNVMLLVSNPDIRSRTVDSFVETSQVAPTILQILGYDPSALDAVRKEGTPVLPGLDDSQDHDH